jgi:diaminopimelate epimerase
MEVTFFKYQGTGNDFIMIDNRAGHFRAGREQIASLCTRRTGIGSDGLILLEKHPGYDFSMRYFNADGGESTMCGNGGRCVIAFAHFLDVCGEETRFMAVDGEHTGGIRDGVVRLKMNDVTEIRETGDGWFLDTGSPHYVLFREDVEHAEVFREGRELRHSDLFSPEGTNVNFTEVIDPQTIFNRTYERGVEDETLSCGTGSIAAALTLAHTRQNVSSPVTVLTRGGRLKVYFRKEEEGIFREIYLEGPAQQVFRGTFEIRQ